MVTQMVAITSLRQLVAKNIAEMGKEMEEMEREREEGDPGCLGKGMRALPRTSLSHGSEGLPSLRAAVGLPLPERQHSRAFP